MANKLTESESEALSIFANSDSESFEGFNSSGIRAAENNLRSKIQSKSKKHDNVVNGTQPSCSTSNKIDSSVVGPNNEKGKKSVKNVPQKRKATNKGKSFQNNKKKKKDSNITDVLLSMSTEEIDKFKDMMGFNELICCVYNLANENRSNRGQEIENETMMNNQNEQTDDDFSETPDNVEHVEDSFYYFDNEEHENDWALPDWFTVDKKGGDVDTKLADMVNSVCITEGDTEKLIEKYPRPANCKYLTAPKIDSDIWQMLPKFIQNRDAGFQAFQKIIASGIVPLMKVAQLLVPKSKENNADLRPYIKDAIISLGSSIFALSQKRRYLLRKVLPAKFVNLCNASQSVTEQLFGDEVQKKMRDLADFEKCKRKTGYHWQPYRRGARYITNFRGNFRNRAGNYGPNDNRPFLGQRGQYRRKRF